MRRPLHTFGLVVTAFVATAVLADLVGIALVLSRAHGTLDWIVLTREPTGLPGVVVGKAADVTVLPTALVAFAWYYRAYGNLPALGQPADHARGWVVGAWIIPVASWFWPYSLTKELWEKTAAVADERFEVPWLLPLWWATWLGSQLVGLVSKVAPDIYALAEGDPWWGGTGLWCWGAGQLLHVVAGVCFIAIVRTISERQDAVDGPAAF